MTAEAKSCDKRVLNKICCDFDACSHLSVKKLSLDNSGEFVFEGDVKKLLDKTTFTLRYCCLLCVIVSCGKKVSESGLKKCALGVKVLCDRVAVEGSVDVSSEQVSGSVVYGVGV